VVLDQALTGLHESEDSSLLSRLDLIYGRLVLPICPFARHSFSCHRCFLFLSSHLFLFQILDTLHSFGPDDIFSGVIDCTISFVQALYIRFSSFAVFCQKPLLIMLHHIAVGEQDDGSPE
jgi:hypothetical protein